MGGAEVCLDKLTLTQYVGGWYPLFPMHSFGSDSNDSPWPLAVPNTQVIILIKCLTWIIILIIIYTYTNYNNKEKWI